MSLNTLDSMLHVLNYWFWPTCRTSELIE